jgi:uncharacterized protein YndB with AHSA1/START domain
LRVGTGEPSAVRGRPATRESWSMTSPLDPRDLVFDREVPVPVSHLWDGWTDPQVLMKWFCPLPYLTVEAEIDLRPGGVFRTVMKSPEGVLMPNRGAWLAVEPQRRLVWTSTVVDDFRPAVPQVSTGGDSPSFAFTCELCFSPTPTGSRYVARAMHATIEDRATHEAMQFHEGWGAALDQLVALYGA